MAIGSRLIASAVMLVVFGSLYTLTTKWIVHSKACGVYGCAHGARTFIHPYVVSLVKFLGEFFCLIIYIIWRAIRKRRSQGGAVEPLLSCCQCLAFLPPALCSVVALVTVHIALNLTYASTSQMLRGSSVLFVGLLSMAFLAQTVLRYHWLGMVITAVGLATVGSADIIFNAKRDTTSFNLNAIIAGGLLLLLAQVVTATQSVLEQRYVRKHSVSPLLAVGLEGLFGTLIVGPLLGPMYYIHAYLPLTTDPTGKLENVHDALVMMQENWQIMTGVIGLMISSTIFNYIGMIIIKEQSAVTKSVLEACQVVPTWIVATIAGWMSVSGGSLAMQSVGSILILFFGPMVYFDKIFGPYLRRRGWIKEQSLRDYSDDFNGRPRYPDELQEWGARPDDADDNNDDNDERLLIG